PFGQRLAAIRASFRIACSWVNTQPRFARHFQLDCIVTQGLASSIGDTASLCVEMAARRKAVAVIGPLRSENAAACADALARFRVPLVTPSATRSDLADRDRYPGVFRTCPPAHFSSRAAVDLLKNLRAEEVGILCERQMELGVSNFQV